MNGTETIPAAERQADPAVALRIHFGSCRMRPEAVRALQPGCIVELDSLADDYVDVYADGRLVARGEALTVDGKLAVRIREVTAEVLRSAR